MSNKSWYKKNESDNIWWLDNGGTVIDEFIFSFDKKKEYNMYRDYPYALTKEEKEIFDKENIYWAYFFSDRSK